MSLVGLGRVKRVTSRKSRLEQIWSALPQITDIDSSREDFSVGPTADVVVLPENRGSGHVIQSKFDYRLPSVALLTRRPPGREKIGFD